MEFSFSANRWLSQDEIDSGKAVEIKMLWGSIFQECGIKF